MCAPDTVKPRTRNNLLVGPGSIATFRTSAAVAVLVLFAAALVACNGGNDDSAADGQVSDQEETVKALEESHETLSSENAVLKDEIAVLSENLEDRDARIVELEDTSAKFESTWPDKEEWPDDKDDKLSSSEGDVLERTSSLAEESGGEVHFVEHPGRGDRSVLVTPQQFADGETPLIVSLHGFGGNSADQAAYIPLHERVNTDGLALLLPNGTVDSAGNRFWNPTDECCEGGKSGEDDVAFLTELVAEARKVKNFGPVYFVGYSNGGFMANHMACKGMPGLRAVASLAGTSYVDDAACAGAPPVSALHIHGTGDGVVLFEGDESEPDPKNEGESAFYLGASEMTARWSRKAGCDWPEHFRPYATLDLDQYVPGLETQAFRLDPDCAEGITVELWIGEGSGHSPAYGDAFVDALLDWLLAQK